VIRAILALAVLLRVIGALVNTEANDDHMEVVMVIALDQRIPADDELREAFQPKLYHATVAGILRVFPGLSQGARVRVGQAVSGVAGVLTLLVVLSFLRTLPLSPRVRLVAFALTAFNPQLLSASIQATNDALGILLISTALAAGYRFFRTFDLGPFAAMTAGVLLGCIAKGNGLAAAIAVVCAFVAALVHPAVARGRVLGYAAVFLVAFAAFVPPLGGYLTRYQDGRSPFATSWKPLPAPRLFEKNYDPDLRPGILSVVDGFLTFRLANMLEEPLLSNDGQIYPRHRTSFWSLLYGYAHSTHYPYWPETWQSNSAVVLWLTRGIWILALVPTLMLAMGVARAVVRTATDGLSRITPSAWNAEFLLATTAVGYLGFVMLYGYLYRDFSTMKALFIYPAIIPYVVCFARALEWADRRGRGPIQTIAYGSGVLLCVAYLADVTILLGRLAGA
jgi:hypothetical protein